MGILTLGGLLLTGLSTWVMGWRMLKGTNPTWLKSFLHFHQRLEDSITCLKEENSESPGATSASHLIIVVTSSVSPCCTDSSVLFLAMKSYMQL